MLLIGPGLPNGPPIALSRRKFRIMSRDDTLFAATQSSCDSEARGPRNTVDGLIRAGDTILLRLPTGDIKSCKLEADSYVAFRIASPDNLTPSRMVNLGKFGSFLADELVSQPYGLTYEVVNKTISVIPPPAVQELGKRVSLSPGYLSMTWTQRTPMRQMSS
jgi:hypothetical protein